MRYLLALSILLCFSLTVSAEDIRHQPLKKVYFESAPGFFVTGNLYRPKNVQGKAPGIMFAHGHRKDARLYITPEDTLRKKIADGEERFERAGLSTYQSECRQLALMGCVVWLWDMLGDSDSIQLSRELVHRFAKQRPEMNTTENWGLFSPQAEAHCQNVMGLQTLNAVRGLDFLLSLPEVDPGRVAVTGASGGGTQTMILAAIDRVAIDTQQFRFGQLLDYRDPMFLPGGAKYLDLPGIIALNAPRPLWLAGEAQEAPVIAAAYRAAAQADKLVTYTGEPAQQETTASQWLLK